MTPKLLYILKDKTPVACDDMSEWAEAQKTQDRQVKETFFDDGTRISTVFLGLDHNHVGGKPLLFETMVFSDCQDINEEMWRYSTWQEAETGHEVMVERVQDCHPELWIIEKERVPCTSKTKKH